jgi:hypothetical protein
LVIDANPAERSVNGKEDDEKRDGQERKSVGQARPQDFIGRCLDSPDKEQGESERQQQQQQPTPGVYRSHRRIGFIRGFRFGGAGLGFALRQFVGYGKEA